MAETENVQRTLGRIEGALNQMLGEVRMQHSEFVAHQQRDFESLEILAKAIAKQREDTLRSFSDQDVARNARLDAQDEKLDRLKQDSDRARGACWVIISLFGGLATFLGAAVIAALNHWIKF